MSALLARNIQPQPQQCQLRQLPSRCKLPWHGSTAAAAWLVAFQHALRSNPQVPQPNSMQASSQQCTTC
ncbi:hypothetical protein OEZ86_006399 [Tetradesmus obliquus]|nr:hypothetical protein OEZ86_006399 [Tetradesmus obliquus]